MFLRQGRRLRRVSQHFRLVMTEFVEAAESAIGRDEEEVRFPFAPATLPLPSTHGSHGSTACRDDPGSHSGFIFASGRHTLARKAPSRLTFPN